jgi:hypothetical protein
MLLAHALTLTKARSYVAALADRARTAEASSAYEHALIELDWIHGDDVPALDTLGLTTDRDILLLDASTAVLQLAAYGVDALGVELVLAALYDAHALEGA